MRYRLWALSTMLISGAGFATIEACTGSGGSASSPAGDASTDGAAHDAIAPDAPADSPTDALTDGGEPTDSGATFLSHFDTDPEGLWRLGEAGPPIVSYANLATLATVSPDGGTEVFGTIGEAGTASNSLTLGIATDVAGNVYVGVANGTTPDAGNVPPPGVYRFTPDGGAGTIFSSAPGMKFPNGLDFVGSQLYVADSDGFVYSIGPDGTAAVWSSDPLLAPDAAACDAGVPLAIGANGIVNDANNFYVTNTDFGRLVKIPIESDGGAGAGTSLAADCQLLGADGIVIDPTNDTFLVALNVQNELVRVSTAGQITVLASGPPLNTPASVLIDSTGAARRLLFTNATFFSGSNPGLLALPLP